MKRELHDRVNWEKFEGNEYLKIVYNDLLKHIEEKLDINLYGLIHEYGTFRLFAFLNRENLEESSEQLKNTMDYIINAYYKNEALFKTITISAIKNRDDALEFFWEYRENLEKYLNIREDKYNFRSKAMTLLKSFQELIENMIKREAKMLAELNVMEGNSNRTDDKLFSIVKNVFDTPTYDFSTITSNLSGVSVNQFRNIVAHSNFKLENEKICATYGTSNKIEFSLAEAEKFLYEIYRLRMFIKLTLNLTIDFMIAKHQELRAELKIIPESAITDLNGTLNYFEMKICFFEIRDDLEIGEVTYSNDGEVYFVLTIESKKNMAISKLEVLIIAMYELIPMFSTKNNMPSIEEVLWVLNVKCCEKDEMLTLAFGYDQIKILQEDPIAYAKVISDKIKKDQTMAEFIDL